jgi:hypothetical protein
LLLALILQFVLPSPAQPPEGSALTIRPPRLVTLRPVPEYSAILSAPIFAPDRKPGDAAGGGSPGGDLAGYSAVGAVAGNGVATVVMSGPGGAVVTLSPGDSVAGWRLVSVARDKVVFERNGSQRALGVGAPTAPAPGSTPQAAPAGGPTPSVQ